MEEGIGIDAPLDYATFQFVPRSNCYAVFVSHHRSMERLVMGSREQIVLYIPSVSNHFDQSNDNFRLHPSAAVQSAQWFTKRTLSRFFQIVGASKLLNRAMSLENEMCQLEEARRFHLALYSEGNGDSSTNKSAGSYLEALALTRKHNVSSSDPTKNELLRAMDVRLAALRDELTSTLNQASGSPSCTFEELSHLLEFTEHFGAVNLMTLFLKYFTLGQNTRGAYLSNNAKVQETRTENGHHANEMGYQDLSTQSNSSHRDSIPMDSSSAPNFEIDARTPSNSDESSDSSSECQHRMERSRPMIRSASPRRSASPMRRVQIGRSGSRRPQALTIKSLGVFPPRDRFAAFNKDDEDSNGDEDKITEVPKKVEASVKSISVKDAINLFEKKQVDTSMDPQKRRASIETGGSFGGANKAVLRRWSSGNQNVSPKCQEENATEVVSQKQPENLEAENEDTSVQPPGDSSDSDSHSDEGKPDEEKFIEDDNALVDYEKPHTVESKEDKTVDIELTSVEWNQKKDAELNQMLQEMMESNTTRLPGQTKNSSMQNSRRLPGQTKNISTQSSLNTSGEHRGGFYGHYRERRDAKLKEENPRKRAEKDAKIKTMQQDLDRKKAEMVRKSAGVTRKPNNLGPSQKPLRNSAPPALTKSDATKPLPPKKVSPRTSPMSATRSSVTSLASSKTTTSQTKASTPKSVSTASTRRKSQPVSPTTRTIPKVEQSPSLPLPKPTKGSPSPRESKPSLKAKENKKQNLATRSNIRPDWTRSTAKALSESTDDLGNAGKQNPKVAKKSSIVPLESKESKAVPRKGTRPSVSPVAVKSRQTTPSKDETSSIQAHEPEVAAEPISKLDMQEFAETNQVQETAPESRQIGIFVEKHSPENNVPAFSHVDNLKEHFSAIAKDQIKQENVLPIETVMLRPTISARSCELEEVSDIIWAEMEHINQEDMFPVVSNSRSDEVCLPTAVASELSVRSPKVRHSLSQMLQAEWSEAEIVSEWGNAENPPALVYQRESPKGLKRLLKFGRKSRGGNGGDGGSSGWASPPVGSEGEDDNEDLKGIGKRNIDALLRKSAPHMKGFGHHKTIFSDNYDGGNSSKRSVESNSSQEFFSGHSIVNGHGHNSSKFKDDAGSIKASRSFFSLSNFRSKGNDSKPR